MDLFWDLDTKGLDILGTIQTFFLTNDMYGDPVLN